MFVRDSSVNLKASASLIPNNLSILPSKDKQSFTYAVVHKAVVCLSNIGRSGNLTYRQVTCKGESAAGSSSVLQARWCVLPERTVLVVASLKGVQMFEPDGSIMIFWQSVNHIASNDICSQFARGISAVGDQFICVGLSDGGIMVFDIPARGTSVKLQETLTGHKGMIYDITSYKDKLLSADQEGNIIIWQSGGHFSKLSEIKGLGFPCSSLKCSQDLIFAAYGTGHIRVFLFETKNVLFEACAHGRWITGLDFCPETNMLLSSSEDSFVRVWKVCSENMEMLFQHCITDTQLSGCQFVGDDGLSFAVTGYDLNEIIVFTKQKSMSE